MGERLGSASISLVEDMHIPNQFKVLAFDVFGTVVDWHTSITEEVRALQAAIDPDAFALAWRRRYVPAMQRVISGEMGWTKIDDLHRMILDDILVTFNLDHMGESERRRLNSAWHRLKPWPDSLEGLRRLKSKHIVCTLSNGNIGLLTNMAKHAGLPWDCILSAETFRKYKPDPATYLGVADVFGVHPAEVALVAAHQEDLDGALSCGLGTAYIERPFEYGAKHVKDVSLSPRNTLHARDLVDLAVQLGC